jgi:hypothetical protein
MTTYQIIISCVGSLLKASVIPLVYEVATLVFYVLGLFDTEDYSPGILQVHHMAWYSDITIVILTSTTVLFLINLFRYLRALRSV